MNMLTVVRSWAGRLGIGIALLFLSQAAAAQASPLTIQSLFLNQAGSRHGDVLEAQAGLIYNDNVDLAPGGAGDTIAMIGLVGNTERLNAPRFDYHVDADIALVKYFKSDFSTQPFGYADAFGEFKIVPGTLAWTVRDTFSQAIINQEGPINPDNLESINYLTTGPQLVLKPTLRTTITIDGTYSDVYSDSKSIYYVNINSHRYGGDLRIERAFSSAFSAYVLGTYSRVKFVDTTDNTDFAYEQGVAGFHLTDSRTYLDAQAGYQIARLDSTPSSGVPPIHIHGDTQSVAAFFPGMPLALLADPLATAGTTSSSAQSPSGVNWTVSLARLISKTQRVSIHATKQITDSANLFQLNLSQPVPGNQQQNLANGQPFTYREYGGTWAYDTGRTSVTVNALSYSNKYQQTPQLNHDSKQLNALATRQINLPFSAELGVIYEHDNFTQDFSQHSVTAIGTLRWRLGAKVGLRFFYAHTSVNPNGYNDNQIGVTATYALTRAAQATDAIMTPTAPGYQPMSGR